MCAACKVGYQTIASLKFLNAISWNQGLTPKVNIGLRRIECLHMCGNYKDVSFILNRNKKHKRGIAGSLFVSNSI